jgi:hypothetical protein
MQSIINRCWSLKAHDCPSFNDIIQEFAANRFALVPGASPRLIFEYVRSVRD